MLQQTRVETVIPYYERFLARFPDVYALAAAELEEVLRCWAGLGYYSRARNLRAAAQRVVERHGGALPADPEALRALPGVGRYTAGAVASIAFDRPEPVVDGNVARVLSRLLEIRDPTTRADVQRRLWEEAARLARGARPGDWNQALMELGARICTPRAPRCPACPVRRWCAAHAAGDPETIPVRSVRAAPRRVRSAAALVLRAGRVLAVRRPAGGLLGGLWEMPARELHRGERPREGAERAVRDGVGLVAHGWRDMGVVEHVLTHRRLRLHVFRCQAEGGRVRRQGFEAHRWVVPRRLEELPIGTLTRKVLARALGG